MKIYVFIIIISVLIVLFFVGKKVYNKIRPEHLFSKINCAFDIKEKKYPEGNKKKNITILSIENRKFDLVDLHNKNVKEYAQLHNYKYIFLDNYDNTLNLPVYWWKLQAIRDIFNIDNSVEYILWLDSDSIISHKNIPLEYLIDLSPESSIFIGRDWPNKETNAFCAGVFLIKNNDIGKMFINECLCKYLSNDKCKDNEKGNYILNGKYAGECYEQGVMNKLLNEERYIKHMFEIPNTFLVNGPNAFGAVIVHLYGNKTIANYILKNYLKCKKDILPLRKQPKKIGACILLTMHVGNNKDRIQLYNENIEKWLKLTDFDIFVVESSGIYFDKYKYEPRVKQYIFQQVNTHNLIKSLSIYEQDSILRIFDHYKKDFENYDIIFKITGKYYLPELENIVNYIPIDSEIILQNQENTFGQNSEIVGIKPSILKEVMDRITFFDNFERTLNSIKCGKNYKTYKMPKLIIDKLVKRSDGSVLEYL